jgi:hypothetical protein
MNLSSIDWYATGNTLVLVLGLLLRICWKFVPTQFRIQYVWFTCYVIFFTCLYGSPIVSYPVSILTDTSSRLIKLGYPRVGVGLITLLCYLGVLLLYCGPIYGLELDKMAFLALAAPQLLALEYMRRNLPPEPKPAFQIR